MSPCSPIPPQETLQHQQVVLVQFPIESLRLFSEFWCRQSFVFALQDWSLCFPQSCGSLVIKSCWPSKSDSLGIPSPFVGSGSPGWEAWHGVLNCQNSGRASLVLLFSSLQVTHPVGMGFNFIIFVPLLPSCCSFFFVFGHGVYFFGRFQHPPVNGYSIASCDFGALAGDECTYSISTVCCCPFRFLFYPLSH